MSERQACRTLVARQQEGGRKAAKKPGFGEKADSKFKMDRLIFRAFKAKGFTLTSNATNALKAVLNREEDPASGLDIILEKINEKVVKRELKSSIIDVDAIANTVADLTENEEDLAKERLQLIDAFDSPKIAFDERQKNYKVIGKPSYQLLGTVNSRANMYRERMLLVQQRLLRSGRYSFKGVRSGSSATDEKPRTDICTIESLLGSGGVKILLGLLTQIVEGQWHMEDLGSIIRLDLSNTYTNDYNTEGCFVLVEGELVNGLFRVNRMWQPELEEREMSINAIGTTDVFANDIRPHQLAGMLEMEEEEKDRIVVILSEVHLDRPTVLEALQKLFDGFENSSAIPFFILMGSFLSKPSASVLGGRKLVTEALNALADLISIDHPRLLSEARFLLVPGPYDFGCPSAVVLPRKKIPDALTNDFCKRVPNATFASNPCRIRYYTQEIVLYRENLVKKMQKHLVVPVTVEKSEGGGKLESLDISEQVVNTVLNQAHLCPLPLQAKPVFWDLDYTMRLFPLPHLLILAEQVESFSYTQGKGNSQCSVANPGPFAAENTFIVYHPATRQVDKSRIW